MNSVMKAVLSLMQGTAQTNTHSNNNTPVASPTKKQVLIAGDPSLVATPHNALQLYNPNANILPPISSILPPPKGKKNPNKIGKSTRRILTHPENSDIELTDLPTIRKSRRLQKANSVIPMGGLKYV